MSRSGASTRRSGAGSDGVGIVRHDESLSGVGIVRHDESLSGTGRLDRQGRGKRVRGLQPVRLKPAHRGLRCSVMADTKLQGLSLVPEPARPDTSARVA